jgi:hypothetical protein
LIYIVATGLEKVVYIARIRFLTITLYNIKKCKMLYRGTISIEDIPAGSSTTHIFELSTPLELSGPFVIYRGGLFLLFQ